MDRHLDPAHVLPVRGALSGIDASPRGLVARTAVGGRVDPPQPPIGQVRQLWPIFLIDEMHQTAQDVGVRAGISGGFGLLPP